MAATQKKSSSGSSKSGGSRSASTSARSGGRKSAQPQKNPIRREVWAACCAF